MKWSKKELRSLQSAISGGSLYVTGGLQTDQAIDARAKISSDRLIAYKLALMDLGHLSGIWERYVCGERSHLTWLDTDNAKRVYPNLLEEMKERTRKTLKEYEKKAKWYEGLFAKLKEAKELPSEVTP